MKKTMLIMATALTMVACGGGNDPKTPDAPKGGGDIKNGLIAYVEYDSLMNQYEYCKEYAAVLEEKQKDFQQQIASKQSALETAARNFQTKMQNGQITSEDQYNKEQASLQKKQEEVQKLALELEEKLATEQNKINTALHDSVQNFIKEFNKDGHYAMILAKAGDNVLYADPSLDITSQVVSGLNKRYKKTSK